MGDLDNGVGYACMQGQVNFCTFLSILLWTKNKFKRWSLLKKKIELHLWAWNPKPKGLLIPTLSCSIYAYSYINHSQKSLYNRNVE